MKAKHWYDYLWVYAIIYFALGVISQILCKHRFRCKTEQNIFKAGAAEAVSALSTK